MAKIGFTKKIRFVTFILAITMFLVAFSGCKNPLKNNHVVGNQINVVDNVYHEVYIEEGYISNDNGNVIGLHDEARKILDNADAIYDGAKEVYLISGQIKGLENKVLGSEGNVLRIVKGNKEYTLEYMYVTRAIRNVNDLSVGRNAFPTMPSNYVLEKNGDYIFGLDIMSKEYTGNVRVPTIKVEGYYVLADDIDVQSTAFMAPNDKVKNVIKAGYADYRPSSAFLQRTDVGFLGTFDGRGHTIKNLTSWQGGIFGYINGGTIKNTAFINVCNYWQGANKNIFADYSVNAHFENLYVKLRAQGSDNGTEEFWSNFFSKGTVHVKDCVLESFILDKEAVNNTNYLQFLNKSSSSTYENVHCVGSSPLSVVSIYDYYGDKVVKLDVTEKEMMEFDGRDYGEILSEDGDSIVYKKFHSVLYALDLKFVELVELTKTGVEKYDTIDKFMAEMKNNSTSVQSFVETGCWNFDSTTGALTWKNI